MYSNNGLCYDLIQLYDDRKAYFMFRELEKEIKYLPKELTKVNMYGRWLNVPREVVAFGNDGVKYRFSGSCISAKPWTPLLLDIKTEVENITGENYNFVLINRYADGKQYIGAHMDNEVDLVQNASIACVSFGQNRPFVFSRKNYTTQTINLSNGSLLIMKKPKSILVSFITKV